MFLCIPHCYALLQKSEEYYQTAKSAMYFKWQKYNTVQVWDSICERGDAQYMLVFRV